MTIDDRILARRARAASSSVVAAVAVVAAATAHALAGGGMASLPTVAITLLVGVPLGMLVVGRRVTAPRAVAGVALDQAIFHGLFSALGPASMPTATAAGHAHHATHQPLGVAPASAALLDTAPMVVSHSAAALLALAVLLLGRAAIARGLESLARTILRAVCGASVAEPAFPGGRVHPHRTSTAALCETSRHTAISRRGPPVVV